MQAVLLPEGFTEVEVSRFLEATCKHSLINRRYSTRNSGVLLTLTYFYICSHSLLNYVSAGSTPITYH